MRSKAPEMAYLMKLQSLPQKKRDLLKRIFKRILSVLIKRGEKEQAHFAMYILIATHKSHRGHQPSLRTTC